MAVLAILGDCVAVQLATELRRESEDSSTPGCAPLATGVIEIERRTALACNAQNYPTHSIIEKLR
jgi:hypothetical protein